MSWERQVLQWVTVVADASALCECRPGPICLGARKEFAC